MSLTKAELIDRIVRNRELPPDITKKCVGLILDTAFEEIAGYFVRTRLTRNTTPRFTFPGFGTFTKKRRAGRRGVNPQTLEPIEIEATDTIDFKPASALKQSLAADRSAVRSGRGSRGVKRKAGAKRKKAPAKNKKTAAKTKKTAAKRKAKDAGSLRGPRSVSGRVLTSREDAELETSLEEKLSLPEAPLQRASARRKRGLGSTG